MCSQISIQVFGAWNGVYMLCNIEVPVACNGVEKETSKFAIAYS